MTEKLFPRKVDLLMELRAMPVQLHQKIKGDKCHQVIMNIPIRLLEVLQYNTNHTEYVLH